ncbi:MAG TPA: hypothetical protein VN778_00965 [Verrucomicrobiae bacterium]|nr:hypothetical protein [Verrucomicrobiae bacterium]
MNAFDEEMLMENFDRWNDRDKRERFLRRMEHKLHAKELRYPRGA